METEHRIVAAAVKDVSGKIWTLPPPARHHDIVHEMCKARAKGYLDLDNQGFILENGQWVSRKAAAYLVMHNGQCNSLHNPGCLYSEDLW
jgi:hypothetical protein